MSRQEKSPRATSERLSRSRNSRAHLKAGGAAVAVVLVGAVVIGALRDGDGAGRSGITAATSSAATAAPALPSVLEADHALHEFGDIPIDGGTLESSFVVRNTDAEPARIIATYTSCMCTTVTLTFPDGNTEGPFGMQGHELPVTLDRVLAAGEALTMRVRFDPLAHGPEATGPVQRAVAVHTDDDAALVVRLTANVVSE